MDLNKIERTLKSVWVKRALQLLVLIACLVFIYNRIQQVDISAIAINYFALAISLLLTAIGTWLGAVSWWITLRVFRQMPSLNEIKDIQFKSNLVKYIPGYGWQLVGKSYMTARIGHPLNVVVASMLFEFFEIFVTGFFLMALFIPIEYDLQHPVFTFIVENRFLIQALALILLITFPLIFQFISTHYFKKHLIPRLEMRWVLLLITLLGFTWMMNSFAFSQLYTALGIQTPISYPLTVFVFTLTFLIGFLVFFAPGSIGVRESFFILLLTPVAGGPIAGLIAVVYRLVTVLAEVFVAIANYVYKSISDNLARTRNNS